MSICSVCGKTITKSQIDMAVNYKNMGLIHAECFNRTMKILKAEKDSDLKKSESKKKPTKAVKPKVETIKDAVSDEEYIDKQSYYKYLKSILGLVDTDKLSAKIYAVTDKYINTYEFTYIGMYNTLVYLNEIINKELMGDIVGIIPYYYSEAEEFYKSLNKVEESNKGKDISSMYHQKIVYINPSSVKGVKQIDITEI